MNLISPNGENLQGHWLRVIVCHPMVGFYRNIIAGANKISNRKPHSVSLHGLLGEVVRGRGRRGGIGIALNKAKGSWRLEITWDSKIELDVLRAGGTPLRQELPLAEITSRQIFKQKRKEVAGNA